MCHFCCRVLFLYHSSLPPAVRRLLTFFFAILSLDQFLAVVGCCFFAFRFLFFIFFCFSFRFAACCLLSLLLLLISPFTHRFVTPSSSCFNPQIVSSLASVDLFWIFRFSSIFFYPSILLCVCVCVYVHVCLFLESSIYFFW